MTAATPSNPVEFWSRLGNLNGRKLRLYPYQVAWMQDKSVFRITNKSRQIGYTTGWAMEDVHTALWGHEHCNYIATREGLAKEYISLCRELWAGLPQEFREPLIVDNSLELMFAGGGRIVGFPSLPGSVRGGPAHIKLDEFAHVRQDAELFAAAVGKITRGDLRLSVASTPFGKRGRFWELYENIGGKHDGWSRHQVMWDECPDFSPEKLKLIRDEVDEDTWLQEYCCAFLDDDVSLIPLELILARVSYELENILPEPGQTGELYLGVDIGRKKHATEIVALERRGGTYRLVWRRRMKRVSFEEQKATMAALLRRDDVKRLAIDSTGLGMNLAEDLEREFGTGKVQSESFTSQKKERWATFVRQVFESGRIAIPEDRDLMNQIRSIHRVATDGAHFRYDVAAGEKGHHADAFWALALALDAGREEGYVADDIEFIDSGGSTEGDPLSDWVEESLGVEDYLEVW